MKKTIFALTITSLLSFHKVPAQSSFEHLGAIKTNFQIYSDTTNLLVSEQILIKPANRDSYSNYKNGEAGYGYEEYHLEFTTQKTIHAEYSLPGYHKRFYQDDGTVCKLVFYDQSNNILATKTILSVDMLYNPGKVEFYFYSVDLRVVPIVLLEKTLKINIVELKTKNKREARNSN